jgi:hypothetical protein
MNGLVPKDGDILSIGAQLDALRVPIGNEHNGILNQQRIVLLRGIHGDFYKYVEAVMCLYLYVGELVVCRNSAVHVYFESGSRSVFQGDGTDGNRLGVVIVDHEIGCSRANSGEYRIERNSIGGKGEPIGRIGRNLLVGTTCQQDAASEYDQ